MESAAMPQQSLSDSQKLAIGWDEGAFLLLAGPGSGKTTVLTRRVIRLLDESPDDSFKILALTFTNRAADEMRSRVEEALSDAVGERLLIGTFHSFAADVLRQAGQNLGLKADFKIYSSDDDRADILAEAVKTLDVGAREYLNGASLLTTFDRAGSLLLTPDALERRLLNKERSQQIAAAYQAYHQFMIAANVQDFTSLVLNAFRLFEKYPALCKRYRQTYRYWHVDEFQDTTYAQFHLLSTISGQTFKNIFAVADDDQIIFQWNGASYQRIQEYIQDFNPTVLQLPANYRCPDSIVQLANKLIAHNKLRQPGKEPLVAAGVAKRALRAGEITLYEFDDDIAEAAGIAEHVVANPSSAVEPTVVLARTKATLELVQSALRERQVPARLVQRRAEFQTLEFRWLHCALRSASRRADQKAVNGMIGLFNAISGGSIALEDVVAQASVSGGDYLKAWRELVRSVPLKNDAEPLVSNIERYLIETLDYETFVLKVVEHFDGLLWLEETRERAVVYAEDREAWRNLTREIRLNSTSHPTLDAFLQELELRSKEPPLKAGEIALMTIHTAKGSEFEHVILVGLAEDILPSYQSLKKGEASPEMEEERRNCFVAITRARQTLTLSRAKRYRGWSKQPSRFLREMQLIHS